MSKKGTKGRGVIAIALFQQAAALERWAAAQESIASTNHRIAVTNEEHLAIARADYELRANALRRMTLEADLLSTADAGTE